MCLCHTFLLLFRHYRAEAENPHVKPAHPAAARAQQEHSKGNSINTLILVLPSPFTLTIRNKRLAIKLVLTYVFIEDFKHNHEVLHSDMKHLRASYKYFHPYYPTDLWQNSAVHSVISWEKLSHLLNPNLVLSLKQPFKFVRTSTNVLTLLVKYIFWSSLWPAATKPYKETHARPVTMGWWLHETKLLLSEYG